MGRLRERGAGWVGSAVGVDMKSRIWGQDNRESIPGWRGQEAFALLPSDSLDAMVEGK